MGDTNRKPVAIRENLRIDGTVIAEQLAIELHGQIKGEIHCGTLVVAPTGRVIGRIVAGKVVVHGFVEGPITAKEVVMTAKSHIKGDLSCETVSVEKGALLEGRITRGLKGGSKDPRSQPLAQPNGSRDARGIAPGGGSPDSVTLLSSARRAATHPASQ